MQEKSCPWKKSKFEQNVAKESVRSFIGSVDHPSKEATTTRTQRLQKYTSPNLEVNCKVGRATAVEAQKQKWLSD